MFLENYVRYTFVRYGVPYVVAIECFDGPSRYRKIACKDADKVAHPLSQIAEARRRLAADGARGAGAQHDRPSGDAVSTVFTYHPPGEFPRTGSKVKTGVVDYTVYSKIRFPMADAPAFANTQFARSEGSPQNYLYPWRDNFCEPRAFFVGQCASGLGHQGQDIRPAYCRQRGPGARCEPYQHDVVAVRDGIVMRAPGQQAIYLVVNAPNERFRVRYLHMSPKRLDADGMVSGRAVKEGEVIGKVGNYWYRERRHHLSPAFRPAGADQIRLGLRQSLHDAGGGLRAADPRPRPGTARGRRPTAALRSVAPVPTPAPADPPLPPQNPPPVAAKPTETDGRIAGHRSNRHRAAAP